MKDLRWPHAFVLAVILLVLGGLAYTGKDSAAVVAGVIAVVAGVGLVIKGQGEVKEQTTAIRDNTNGTMTNLVNLVRDIQNQMVEQQRTHQDQMVEQQRNHQIQMLQLAEKLAGMQPLPSSGSAEEMNHDR